ncbi:hypothetical protein IE077_000236 [Cardiosporidium cionae]|uniref:non-specific serine/threonine protein kinase n=1 Tax=Cardiosporidium cionae TaxID=476202 RepID=A0ABQ7J549_9APIC|nr:hypothetical protein IE077_000236 [Cardiosporidium cionae]|eukprot:KAF8819044.1 hypothetical protein IE077_000236 [Cardiosporidium cionae]
MIKGEERCCISKQCSNVDHSKLRRLLLRVNPCKVVARAIAAVSNPLCRRCGPAALSSLQLGDSSSSSASGITEEAQGTIHSALPSPQCSSDDTVRADFSTLDGSSEFEDCQESTKLAQFCDAPEGVFKFFYSKLGDINSHKIEKCTDVVSHYSVSEASPLSHFEISYNPLPNLHVKDPLDDGVFLHHEINSPCKASLSPIVDISCSYLKPQTLTVSDALVENVHLIDPATPSLCDFALDKSKYAIQELPILIETEFAGKNKPDVADKLPCVILGHVECDEKTMTVRGKCSSAGPTLLSGNLSPYLYDQCNQPLFDDAPRVKNANENRTCTSPESSTEYASSLTLLVLPPLGKEFDFTLCGYEHLCVLARGQFGCTHIVRQLEDNTEWVAKVIDLDDFATDEILLTRREVSYLRRLRHPYIVQYHDSFETESSLVIVMENCSAGDLFTAIRAMRKRNEYFAEEQILQWFTQIVLGLQYMHSQRILHCDLKTTNIFLTCDGVAKIGDFGIACEVEEDGNVLNAEECPRGTPLYMSPEMCKNLPLSDKSDCWSLGCVLYEICCLRHAFDGYCPFELLQSIEENISTVGASIPMGYSPLIVSLISNLLQQEPEDRASLKKIIEMLNSSL